MEILAPWSLASYIPLNGFHPLYRSLARISDRDLRIIVPRKPGLEEFKCLLENGLYSDTLRLQDPDWVKDTHTEDFLDSFAAAHGSQDLLLQNNLPGDVELHHTAPATYSNRSFFLHCESFLPVFFPFLQQGIEISSTRVESIRTFYRALFESKYCLGIASHIPETLNQLSFFFQSKAVDEKLVETPIGLDPTYIADRNHKPAGTTNFAFLNSAHQHTPSFTLRGGIPSLKLAIELLREGADVRFYFRAKRPTDDALASSGVDVAALTHYEADRIIWIEHYLPDWAQSTLLAKCHFMLLPSANLHSVAILSALANGAVPIVTDTIGTDVYVKDMVNGLVIDGVRSAIWQSNEALRITQDRHTAFTQLEPAITRTLIAKVRELLATPIKIKEMAEAGRTTMKQRFSGAAFAGRLVDEIRKRSAASPAKPTLSVEHRFASTERWIEDISGEHFQGPPQPFLRLHIHDGDIFQIGKNFLFLRRGKSQEIPWNRDWSPIYLAYEEFGFRTNLSRTAKPGAVYGRSLSECVRLAQQGSTSRKLTLKEAIYYGLRPYRSPFLAARSGYRTLRRMGLVR